MNYRSILCFADRHILILLFAFSLFAFYPFEFFVAHDLSTYLATAHNFVNGHGMTDFQGELSNHRFGYKLLLSGALSLGGEQAGLTVVALMQSVFSALFSVLLYIFSCQLFNKKVGLLTYAFFMTTPIIVNDLIEFGLDGVWPVFALASLILFFKQPSSFIGVICLLLSGVFCCLTMWVKETAGINLALIPLFLVLTSCADRPVLRLSLFYISFGVALLLGLFIVQGLGSSMGGDSSNEQQSLKSAIEFSKGHYSDNASISLLLFFLDGLKGYFFGAEFSKDLKLYFPAVFMLLFALPYAIYRSILKLDKSYRTLLVIILLYSFYMAWAAQWGMRITQLSLIVSLFCTLIAAASLTVFDLILMEARNRKGRLRIIYSGLAYASCVLLLLYNYTSSKDPVIYFDDNPYLNKISTLMARALTIQTGQKGSDLALYIAQRTDDDETADNITILGHDVLVLSTLDMLDNKRVTIDGGLFSRIVYGVHDNPHTPYFKMSDAYDKHFCMRNSFAAMKRRFSEIYSLNIEHILKRLSENPGGQVWLVLNIKGDCAAMFRDWVEQERYLKYGITFKSTQPRYFEHAILYEAGLADTVGAPLLPLRDSQVYYTDSVSGFKKHIQEVSEHAYSWYSVQYPILFTD